MISKRLLYSYYTPDLVFCSRFNQTRKPPKLLNIFFLSGYLNVAIIPPEIVFKSQFFGLSLFFFFFEKRKQIRKNRKEFCIEMSLKVIPYLKMMPQKGGKKKYQHFFFPSLSLFFLRNALLFSMC